MSNDDALRYAEAMDVETLMRRLEAALRRAPRALLHRWVESEAFVAQVASIRSMTEALGSEIAALEAMVTKPE